MAPATLIFCLTLCIPLASAESSYVNYRANDASRDVSINRHERETSDVLSQMLVTLSQITTSYLQLHKDMLHLGGSLTELRSEVTQLKNGVAELKSSCNKTTEDKVCPTGFTYIAEVNGCYKVVLDNLVWSVAGLRCRSLHKDAHLVFINSAAEQQHIEKMLNNYNDYTLRKCKNHGRIWGVGFWMGVYRADSSLKSPLVWRATSPDNCASSGAATVEMSYTKWQPGHPSPNGVCAGIWRGPHYNWGTHNCLDTICSVCELDL